MGLVVVAAIGLVVITSLKGPGYKSFVNKLQESERSRADKSGLITVRTKYKDLYKDFYYGGGGLYIHEKRGYKLTHADTFCVYKHPYIF